MDQLQRGVRWVSRKYDRFIKMLTPYTEMKAIALQGGAVTRHHKSLLAFGSLSAAQNVRGKHPGFRKRPGQIKLHTTADSTNEVLSLYQFSKNRIPEKHFLAQMSDGDILDATAAPPTVTTGAFGSEIFSGSANQIPGAWGIIDDILIHSNGVDQHQTYSGDDNYIESIVVYKGSAVPPNIPTLGEDYTTEATDGLTTTKVILDSLNTYAAFNCVFICTTVPANKLTWTVGAANGTVSTATLYYRKSDSTWANTSMTDNTKSGTTTLAQTGTMTWTSPADEIPSYMYGRTGFWYQLRVSVQLDAEVEITKITFGSGFNNLINVWNGEVPYAIEAIFYDQSAATYSTYATGSVEISDMTHSADDTADRLYFNSADPIEGVYIDIGATPNVNTTAAILGVYAWDGDSFTTVGTVTDGTNGFVNSGWITWARLATVQPHQFQTAQYYSYWYYIAIKTATLSADIVLSIETMPYFDIEDLGKGQCCCAWKTMAAYSFTLYGSYVYIAIAGRPNCLNGINFGILQAGDGRTNKVVAMRKFYNEMLVFQEERGIEGGCVTLFQGYDSESFGKLTLSSKAGTFSNKTVDVVDGVVVAVTSEDTPEIKTLCFFLSRHGVLATDGLTVSVISDAIQNYFDPTKSECIRKGYEDKMWLSHDSAFNVVRIGLVSGSSATKPNVFPVYDLSDNSWYFDSLAQELSCLEEIEAGSGSVSVLQVGGGIDDGTVYLSNSGVNDVTTAIDSFLTMELNADGRYVQLNEMTIRAEAVAASAGDITITVTKNDIAAGTKTLSMSPEVSGQGVRRHRFNLNVCDQNISLKIQNNAVDKEMALLDVGFVTYTQDER